MKKNLLLIVITLTLIKLNSFAQSQNINKALNNTIYNTLKIRVAAAPIPPDTATLFQSTFLDTLKEEHYIGLNINKFISLGGFIKKETIESLLTENSGIKVHYCWDDGIQKLFAAFQKTPSPIPVYPDAVPYTDDPGIQPFYVSRNYFPTNRGNVSLMNYLPFTDNLIESPTTSRAVADLHYVKTPLRENSDEVINTPATIQQYKQNFRRDFHYGKADRYTVTYFSNAEVNTLINVPGCIGIRYYFGYWSNNTRNEFRIILVAVDSFGNDILTYHDPAYPNDVTRFISTNRIIEKSYP